MISSFMYDEFDVDPNKQAGCCETGVDRMDGMDGTGQDRTG